MKSKEIIRKTSGVLAAFALSGVLITANAPFTAAAESDDTKIIYTDYADLWESEDITVEAGTHVKWYVVVPDDTEPKGCGATVKIPGLGFGTDTHNKEEGHIVLQKGENFIYEFTPEEAGDILFTCWMGSGCHKNYIHVTEAASPVIEDPSSAEVEAPETDGSSESASEISSENAVNAETSSSAEDTSVSDSTADSSSSVPSTLETSSKNSSTSSSTNTAATTANNNPQTGKNVIGSTLASVLLIGSAVLLLRKKKN